VISPGEGLCQKNKVNIFITSMHFFHYYCNITKHI